MTRLNAKVAYKLIRQIAVKLEQKEEFEEDPEIYTIGMLFAIIDGIRPERIVNISSFIEESCFEDNREKAAKLLGRKKVAVHPR